MQRANLTDSNLSFSRLRQNDRESVLTFKNKTMKKEELIKIYSAYLPFKLAITDTLNNPEFILDEDNLGDIVSDAEHLNTIRPHLFPMDMISKEITHKGEAFIPQVFLMEKYGIEVKQFDNTTGYNYFFKGFRNGLNLKEFESYRNQLLEWHFNVFNLPEDQFINKATLNK